MNVGASDVKINVSDVNIKASDVNASASDVNSNAPDVQRKQKGHNKGAVQQNENIPSRLRFVTMEPGAHCVCPSFTMHEGTFVTRSLLQGITIAVAVCLCVSSGDIVIALMRYN